MNMKKILNCANNELSREVINLGSDEKKKEIKIDNKPKSEMLPNALE